MITRRDLCFECNWKHSWTVIYIILLLGKSSWFQRVKFTILTPSNGLYSFKTNFTLLSNSFRLFTPFSSYSYLNGIFQPKFDIINTYYLFSLEKSVICNAVWVLLHCVKNKSRLYASISVDEWNFQNVHFWLIF